MTDSRIERLRQTFGGPMSASELEFLEDLKSFIDFAIENGLSLPVVVSTLMHDVSEVCRCGGSLADAVHRGFLPKVTGYSRIDEQSVGDAGEAA